MTCILSLFFVLHAVSASAVQKKKKNSSKKPVEYALVVAAIHPPVGNDPYYEVIFNESARFYRISRNASPEYLTILRESEKMSTAVLVKRAGEHSDIIIRVKRK